MMPNNIPKVNKQLLEKVKISFFWWPQNDQWWCPNISPTWPNNYEKNIKFIFWTICQHNISCLIITYHILWYLMVSYDIIWYHMTSYDIIWCHKIWYEIIRYDKIWYVMIRHDMLWWHMAQKFSKIIFFEIVRPCWGYDWLSWLIVLSTSQNQKQ